MKLYLLNIKKLLILFFPLVFLFLFISCAKDDVSDDNDSSDDETQSVNEWIDEEMRDVYLWNDEISDTIDYTEESDPAELFEKMLYSEDKWSWITDDWSSLESELEETAATMGFAPAFYYTDNDSSEVVTVIKYVYINSPADKAGLKRGDIILTYDGVTPTSENYYDLYSEDSYTVGLGTYSSSDGTFSSTSESIELTATSFDADPVIYYEIENIENHDVGYLVFSDFYSGVNDVFLDSIDVVMDYFSDNNVTDVIVDLRYNPGGEMATMAYLASALAPASVVSSEKVLTKMIYNSSIQTLFEQDDDADSYLNYRFAEGNANLNLSTIYFLTSPETSSASELLMIGLQPYMNVVMIGDTTAGNYISSWIIPNTEYNWCIFPVAAKLSNASGYTDFKDGIAPDSYVKDNLLPAYDFGDLDDAVLATALEQITGVSVTSTKSAVAGNNIKELRSKQFDVKSRITLPLDKTNFLSQE